MPLAIENERVYELFPPLGQVQVVVERRRIIKPHGREPRVVVGIPRSCTNFQVLADQILDRQGVCVVAGQLIDRFKEPGFRFGWRFLGRVEIDCVSGRRQIDVCRTNLFAA